MATLTAQSIAEAGLTATYTAASSSGDTFQNSSRESVFLHVKNGDASSHTVTIAASPNSYDLPGIGVVSKADIAVAVAAGTEKFIGPIPLGAFGSSPDITYDAVTSVTVALIKLPSTGGN